MNKEEIKDLIQYMKEENMKVISIQTDDVDLYLESFPDGKGKKPVRVKEESVLEKKEEVKAGPSTDRSGLVDITVDQIGVFYTQPEEDSDETFVKVGDKVAAGDPVGLIETMKIFNEVQVDQAGSIEEILVSNGEAVEFGQVVMRMRPEGA